MLKRDTLGKAVSAKSLGEAFRCGECLHFEHKAHTGHKDICKNQGVGKFAIAPSCYTPNITQLMANSDEFVALAAMLSNYSSSQKRILLGVLRQKSSKAKLAMGTKLYFHVMGKDYVSNYRCGYVIGYSSDGLLMVIGTPIQKARGKSMIAYFNDTDHVLTSAEWKKKHAELVEKGRIQDPTINDFRKKTSADSETPTIDTAPASWFDKQEKKARKGAKNGGMKEITVNG